MPGPVWQLGFTAHRWLHGDDQGGIRFYDAACVLEIDEDELRALCLSDDTAAAIYRTAEGRHKLETHDDPVG